MIRVRLNTGLMFEALAMQGSSLLVKDSKKNIAFFVPKKSVNEWYNGNSRMLPVMETLVLVDTTPFDNIGLDSIKIYLESMGVKDTIATRIERCCRISDIDSLGNLYRLGKKGAIRLNEMGESSIKELERVFVKRLNIEWK